MNLLDLTYDMKVCSTCKRNLPMTDEYFGKHNATSDGFRNECKECRNQKLVHHWNQDKTKLKCLVCKEYKELDNFDTNKNNAHRAYKDRRCKSCKAKAAKTRKLQRYNKDPLRRIMVERVSGAKERAKKKNTYCDITLEDVQFLWKQQEGKCAISGLPMTYEMGKGRVHSNLSIDQIEPSMGYTLSNIQLVCMAVNQMKSDLGTKELIMYCEAIAKNARSWNKGKK